MSTIEEFEAFFKAHHTNALCLAISIVHDEDVGRDIVSEAFEYLLTHPKSLSESELNNYLFVMVRNRCADHFRQSIAKEKYEAWAQYTFPRMEEDYNDHEAQVLAVQQALTELSPRTREVFEAHYLQGKKYSEVAERLQISQNAVKKHIVTGLRKLRGKLSDDIWICLGVHFLSITTLL